MRILGSSFVALFLLIPEESSRAFATTNRWQVAGPQGGSVHDITVDRQNPNTLYAVSGGAFKSTDGGANWRRVLGPETQVASILVDPLNGTHVYAATYESTFLKSTDAGLNWDPVKLQSAAGTAILEGYFTLAIDPKNPATVYAGHRPACHCPATPGEGLFRSTDRGATWKLLLGSTSVYSVAVDPEQPRVLYLGTPLGAYQSRDGGETWRRISLEDEILGWGSYFAFGPRDSSTVYLGTGTGVFKSVDRGASWQWLFKGFGYADPVVRLWTDPHAAGVVYADSVDGMMMTHDAGAHWSSVGQHAPIPLAWHPTVVGIVYATRWDVDSSVLLKSTDGGATWRRLYSGIVSTDVFVAVAPREPDSVYAWSRFDLFKSTDGARAWRLVSSATFQDEFLSIGTDPQDSQVLYAGKGSGLYKSTDGGASWAAANAGLPGAAAVNKVQVDPRDSRTVYAQVFVFPRPGENAWNGLFKSTDAGASWSTLGDGGLFEAGRILAFAVSPHDHKTLYVSIYHLTMPELYRSTDGGAKWTRLPLTATDPVTDVAFDRHDPDVMYAVAGCSLFKSTDGGAHWSALTSRLGGCVNIARVHAEDGSTLYAATDNGLFKTTDGGASWAIERDVPPARIGGFAIDRHTNRKYAAVSQGGVFSTVDSSEDIFVPLLTLQSTGCIGEPWSLQVSGARADAAVHLVGSSNGRAWEINRWRRTDEIGAHGERGAFVEADEGRHTLYVEVDGATSNEVAVRVLRCTPRSP